MLDTTSPKHLSVSAFLIITTITLLFGLIPRGDFGANWIEYDQANKATWFGEYGYVIGPPEGIEKRSPNNTNTRIDLTLTMHEQLDPNFRVLVFIGKNCEGDPLIIGQWRTNILVMQGCDFPNKSGRARLSTNMTEFLDTQTIVSIILGESDNKLLINNELVSNKTESIYKATDANESSIIIGNTPDGRHGWSGLISTFSIKHVSTINGLSETIRDYKFSEHNDSGVIVDASTSAQSLSIPQPGQFPQKIILAGKSVKSLLTNLRFDAIINLIGFMPMGIVSVLLLSSIFGLQGRTLFATTMLVACAVSLSIELSQVYIAGRKSNLHDLLLNCLGAFAGYLLFSSIAAFRHWIANRKLAAAAAEAAAESKPTEPTE